MNGINTMPIGKFRGQDMSSVDPIHLMEHYEEYLNSKKLSNSQQIIYNYVHKNYDSIQKQVEEIEDNKHNEYHEEENESYSYE